MVETPEKLRLTKAHLLSESEIILIFFDQVQGIEFVKGMCMKYFADQPRIAGKMPPESIPSIRRKFIMIVSPMTAAKSTCSNSTTVAGYKQFSCISPGGSYLGDIRFNVRCIGIAASILIRCRPGPHPRYSSLCQ
jgi:hypothetical protein